MLDLELRILICLGLVNQITIFSVLQLPSTEFRPIGMAENGEQEEYSFADDSADQEHLDGLITADDSALLDGDGPEDDEEVKDNTISEEGVEDPVSYFYHYIIVLAGWYTCGCDLCTSRLPVLHYNH